MSCVRWFSWYAWPTAAPREGRNHALSSTSCWPSFRRSHPGLPRRKRLAAGSSHLKADLGRRTSDVRRPLYRLSRWQRISQFAHRALEYRVPHFRRNFREGFEYETALVHGGMRDGQPFHFDHRVPKQKYVDVEGARPFFLYAPPSHFLFNVENCSQQLPRHLFGVKFDGAIQEPGLGGEFDRFSFVER